MQISANNKKVFLIALSFVLFYFLPQLGYRLGGDFGEWIMQENFGPPRDLYPILFGTAMYFTAVLFGFLSIIIVVVFMHQIGRRLKIAVGKPTFYGFLLYLLTVLRVIILDNLNKGR